ncbi:MAG: metallophosphoesterase [Alistipes sp.]|nr:metallophosphoesterase [Candidatus Minthomonas equi]
MKKITLIIAALVAISAFTLKYNEGEVSYKIWEGYDGDSLPDDFSALGEPTVTGTGKCFQLGDYSNPSKDHFAAEFTSTLSVPEENEYSFLLYSDDNSRFIIDGETLIGLNSSCEYTIAKKTLGKGKHELKLQYQEYENGQGLDLYMCTAGELPRDYGTAAPEYRIPDFVVPQVTEAYKRYREWKGDDETIIFPIFTDIHAHTNCRFHHIGYLAETSDIWNYDFMLCLGDVGVNLGPAHISKDITNTILTKVSDEMKKYSGLFLFIPGNHDWDGGEGTITSEERFQELFQKPGLEKAGDKLHLTPGKVYHYYDIPEKKFRIILLNSCGTCTQKDMCYVFDDEQMEWFKALVDETPQDFSIFVTCHYQPHPNGRWHNTPAPYTLRSNERMMNVLAELKRHHNIIGLLCGDSHFNMHEVDRNVNYFITQSMSACSKENLMPGTRRADLNFDESLCCDVIAVKPAKNEVHTFRIGAGGADYDYEFNY